MKLLVTGGAGFIGSHLLQYLDKQQEHETVVFDNLSTGSAKNVPEGIKLCVGDICDAAAVDKLFAAERFDAVIHFAAQTMVPYSLQHPQEDCNINLLGLLNILEACRKYKVKTVVFSSSAAVYGDNPNIPLTEDLPLLPTSCYGITKMTSEHYLRVYHDLYGLNSIVLRFANVYGERQGEGGEGGVISIFCKLLVQDKPLTVFGSVEQTRDFVYAGDIAQAAAKALTLTGFNIINISTGRETSLNTLLGAFKNACGHDFTVNYAPERSGDIYRSVLSNQHLKELLGFEPKMDIEHGIPKTYEDYLARRKEGN